MRNEQGDIEAPYVKQVEALVKSENKDSVYVQLAKDASIFLTENDKEVEGAFNLMIVTVLGAPQTVLTLTVQTFVDTLTKTESNKTSLKQKM